MKLLKFYAQIHALKDIDIENGHVDTEGDREGGTNWEIRFDRNTLPCVK